MFSQRLDMLFSPPNVYGCLKMIKITKELILKKVLEFSQKQLYGETKYVIITTTYLTL